MQMSALIIYEWAAETAPGGGLALWWGRRSAAEDPATSTRLRLLEPEDSGPLPRKAKAGPSKCWVPGPVFGASSSGRPRAVPAERQATKTWSEHPGGARLCSCSSPCPNQPDFVPDLWFPARSSPSFCGPGPRVPLLPGGGALARSCPWTCFLWPERGL